MPFHDPPEARLLAVATERGVRVRPAVRPDQVATRWESDGRIEGDGLEVLWTPESESDQLRVGERWRGGEAIASLRARDVG